MSSPPPPSRRRRVLQRIVVLLIFAGAVAAYRSRHPAAPEGLVVDVRVEDTTGTPVADARIDASFASTSTRTDAQGRARLEGVVLQSGVEPTPQSIATALAVESRMHAARSGRPPSVEARPDGTWLARYVLSPYGTLRLRVADTPAKGVRAWVEAPGRPGAIEADSGVAVARPGQPATWRTFEAKGDLLVVIEGLTGTAARRTWVPAPPYGMTREIELEAEPAHPIRGRIVVPDGEGPPTLQGTVDVQGSGDAGRPVPYDAVVVGDDGTFLVPYAGKGRYHLTPRLAFAEAESLAVQGGGEVEIPVTGLRPWVVIPTAAWGSRAELAEVRCVALPDETPAHLELGLATGDDAWRVALPAPGRYRIEVDTRGNDRHAPTHGAAEVDASAAGAHVVTVPLAPVPSGEVRVTITPRPDRRQGATVFLHEPPARTATIFPRISATATLPNVRAGPVRIEVTWRDAEAAPVFLVGTVPADGVLALEAEPKEGGLFAVAPPEGPAPLPDTSCRFTWAAGASPHGEAAGGVDLIRLAGHPHLNATARLLPGHYEGRLHGLGGEEGIPLAFDIRAGELTTVAVPSSERR